jgi:sortase A
MKKTLKGLIALIIMIGFLLLIAFLIIYPKKNEITLFYKSLNLQNISRNAALKTLTKLSPPQSEDQKLLAAEQGSVEEISAEELAKYRNSGKTIAEVEPLNTRVKINSANIDGKVFDGDDAHTLSKGLWHFPLSSAPGSEGNFVVIAHRYDKMPPATDTFFNLDKVKVGDKIVVEQKNTKWTYIVAETKIVESNDRTVLMPASDYRITLITCTPLWTSEKRLVVVGKLDKIYGNI